MAKRKQHVLIPKISSLADLARKATTDSRYAELATFAATNLGGEPRLFNDAQKRLDHAMAWLRVNANETTEEGVVGEVNYVRDLVSW
jgi:hypothetical protein